MGNPWALTEWQKEIDAYLIGTTRLYGFVTPKQFLLVFNRYHEQKLLKSELMKYANKLVRQSRHYYIYDNAIVSTLVDDARIDEIYTYQQGKKYYMPTEEQVTKRIDANYYEKTPYTDALETTLVKKHGVSPMVIGSLMRDIIWSIIIEDKNQESMDRLEKYNVNFKNSNDLFAVFQMISELSNNTRKWANCGFTPMEMRKQVLGV